MKCKSSIAVLHISKYLNIYLCWLVLVLAHLSAVGAVKCFTLFHCSPPTPQLEIETMVKRRFAKVSIVSYSRPSPMIIVSASQFHIYIPWSQRPFRLALWNRWIVGSTTYYLLLVSTHRHGGVADSVVDHSLHTHRHRVSWQYLTSTT